MEYRELGTTGLEVSVIAMGCEGFVKDSRKEFARKTDHLFERGLNFFDMYSPKPEFRRNLGATIKGHREDFVLQSHLCSIWEKGQYLRTRDFGKVEAGFDTMLSELDTDYIDVGMIHYVDSMDDWNVVSQGPILEYARNMKDAGHIGHIGLSSHNPQVANAAVESGAIEVLMFSINPCYDMQPADEDVMRLWAEDAYEHQLTNQDDERKTLYELCESKGVGIDVMKVFGGGDLLDAKMSPFKRAFTPAQCIHYCLTRPAVASVMVGCKELDEWDAALTYLDSSDEERDYSSVLAGMERFTFEGHCMYCGHCAPCPVGIDVAAVTKFLNLTRAEGEVTETVREHYRSLDHHASECVACGQCEGRCPFSVGVIENMEQAVQVFGD